MTMSSMLRGSVFLLLLVVSVRPLNGGVVMRSDDISIQDLRTLVEQQAAAISGLQASLTSLQNARTRTVAFSARFSADDANNGIPLSSHAILQFDLVGTNAGNGYNPSNGIFTSPVAGYYAFSIDAMVPNVVTHPNLQLSIVKNGAVISGVYVANTADEGAEVGTAHAVVHLAVGEQVWIRQENGDSVRGSLWTNFTGYLINAD